MNAWDEAKCAWIVVMFWIQNSGKILGLKTLVALLKLFATVQYHPIPS
jgi:hypothetical protein